MPSTKSISLVFLSCAIAAWGLYILLGHRVIEFLYQRNSFHLADWLMQGRDSTPAEEYFLVADRLVFNLALAAILGAVFLFVLSRKPALTAWVCGIFLLVSASLVFLIEAYPVLGEALRLSVNSEPDPALGFRYKALYRSTVHGYRGQFYSPVYAVEVVPETIEWSTDREGFRNPGGRKTSDVVVVGDGFVSGGRNQKDTLTSRLEDRLDGGTVTGLGVGGYGPYQYVEVFKRYGVPKRPRFALFGFNEGNDLKDIRDYLKWKNESRTGYSSVYGWPFASKSLLEKYRTVVSGIVNTLQAPLWELNWRLIDYADARRGYVRSVHREVTVLRLGSQRYEVRWLDFQATQTTEEIMRSEEWRHLEQLLGAFKSSCTENGIVPLIVFIPTAAHIYAQYSSAESGRKWLSIREQQIAAKKNLENAIVRIARDLEIELISLTAVFDAAAKKGAMLYHPLDTHWNSQGAEIAAAFIAEQLKRINRRAQPEILG